MIPGSRPSVRPALIIVLIAVGVVVGGIGLSFATGGWSNGTTSGATGTTGSAGLAVMHLDGTDLGAVSADDALAVIASDGQPPADIRDSLVVPSIARVTGHENDADNLGTFDSSLDLSVAAAPSQVVTFYKVAMKHQGWGLLPGGSAVAGSSDELFYEKAGSDGYYWQVSVTVTPESPSITPELGGGDQTAPTSRLVLDLVQVEDAD